MKSFSEYLYKSPKIKQINYWDLPKNICVELSSVPKKVKLRGKSITIKRLISMTEKNKNINKNIKSILFLRNSRRLPIRLPLSLNNIDFVNLNSLMVSEGSYKSEFRIHVPEKFFHEIFLKSLSNIFGIQIRKFVNQKTEKNILRSSAPTVIRNILPIEEHIPEIILKNKEYCRRYLQISFEAEGSPIFKGSKRYISLKRNTSIDSLIKVKLKYPEERRIYIGKVEKDYPKLINKIKDNPPKTLLGEHLMLKEYFDVNSIIKPEAIRINKTNYRCGGKIAVRWALYIYADSVNRFIKEINFISKRKKIITSNMIKIKGNRRQYFSFELMKKISKKDIINSSDFVKEMKKLKYVSPRAYISRYLKKGILKKIGRGKYKLLVN